MPLSMGEMGEMDIAAGGDWHCRTRRLTSPQAEIDIAACRDFGNPAGLWRKACKVMAIIVQGYRRNPTVFFTTALSLPAHGPHRRLSSSSPLAAGRQGAFADTLWDTLS